MTTAKPSGQLQDAQQSWRTKILVSTWLAYAGLYFCRKAFYVVKGTLSDDLGLDTAALGEIGTAYLVCYTLGQFSSAAVGSRIGPRILLLSGIAASIGANIVFGFANNYWTLFTFMCVNGFAQATGWPSVVGTLGNWTRSSERGTLMGFWGTCYQLGGVMAVWWASFWMASQGWRGAFFAASAVLIGVWVVVFFWQRNKPEDEGLASIRDDEESSTVEQTSERSKVSPWTRELVTNICLVGAFYFGVKFVRYAIWSWTPYFLERNFSLAGDDAGYLSSIFDAAGFFGVIFAGYVSDRYFRGKRTSLSILMLVGMTVSCLAMYLFGSTSLVFFAISLALVGFMLFGPDSLLTGAGAIEIGTPQTAVAAAGIINGFGSIGSVVQELVVAKVYQSSSGDIAPVFALLIGASALSVCALLIVLFRNKQGQANL
jgi:MFS transporter, OPA family, glycerol-3-phosphate transporter